MMKLAAFEAMLGTYGAAMRRWPPDRRAAAQALLTHSPQAREMLRQAALLDAALDGDPAPAIDEARLGAIVAGALAALPTGARAPARRHARPFAGWGQPRWLAGFPAVWARAGGLAACTAAGILVGLVSPLPDPAGNTRQPATVAAEETGTDLATVFVATSSVENLFQ